MFRLLAASAALLLAVLPVGAEEPDGLVLPPGFHAKVVADGLAGVRHMAVRGNGDVYISTRGAGNGIIALRLGPDHKAVQTERFGTVNGGTGIRFWRGMLYASTPGAVYRFKFDGDALVPGAPELVVDGIPADASSNRPIAMDDSGHLFVAVSGRANICADPNTPSGQKPVGLKPCPDLANRAGVWRFDAGRTGQKFSDGERIVTGLRDMDAMDFQRGDALYGIVHDRGALHQTWPEIVSESDESAIAEEMHKLVKGADLGWPYTYYDGVRKVRLAGPEYGGDGKTPVTGDYTRPVVAFVPGHAAPMDLVFYDARQFPRAWRGAFIARHGGLGPDLPNGHNGFDIVFLPFNGGKPGATTAFATGFAGPTPADRNVSKAKYRPTGLAVGPDGALYVSDSSKGRIWRIAYGED